ncbi:helix-turn-helix domain-containing protein [Bacillus benzoevorans]|uniref:DNA-binding Xre family transcriptional regulator n=1 Tax=Bacillus benzoevorans TaxID=1456 RepID=A0A7X0LXH6_9BACI|nr:helix-turn-helix transcriptional regulator [Bacillus benzoevorans]MBB6446429.1 DNA-binding Xre family transcriptional regulator [Bacillus benzoevorans]
MYKCRLKVIFAEKDIRQGEFAEKLGISAAALSAIKNGKSLPSFPVLYRICEELDMDMREIWAKE